MNLQKFTDQLVGSTLFIVAVAALCMLVFYSTGENKKRSIAETPETTITHPVIFSDDV